MKHPPTWCVKVVTADNATHFVDGFADRNGAKAWIILALDQSQYHNALFQIVAPAARLGRLAHRRISR